MWEHFYFKNQKGTITTKPNAEELLFTVKDNILKAWLKKRHFSQFKDKAISKDYTSFLSMCTEWLNYNDEENVYEYNTLEE